MQQQRICGGVMVALVYALKPIFSLQILILKILSLVIPACPQYDVFLAYTLVGVVKN